MREDSGQTANVKLLANVRSYPSCFLRGVDRIYITESGEDVLRSAVQLRPYGELSEIISGSLIERILEMARQGSTVSAVCSALADFSANDTTALHVIWLHKYGLISLRE